MGVSAPRSDSPDIIVHCIMVLIRCKCERGRTHAVMIDPHTSKIVALPTQPWNG